MVQEDLLQLEEDESIDDDTVFKELEMQQEIDRANLQKFAS